MKLFIKILLLVFIALVTFTFVTSATITFPNIQETTTSFSFQNEIPKVGFTVIENDFNDLKNGNNYVVINGNFLSDEYNENMDEGYLKQNSKFVIIGSVRTTAGWKVILIPMVWAGCYWKKQKWHPERHLSLLMENCNTV